MEPNLGNTWHHRKRVNQEEGEGTLKEMRNKPMGEEFKASGVRGRKKE